MKHTIWGKYPSSDRHLISIDGDIINTNWNNTGRHKPTKVSNHSKHRCFNILGKVTLVHRAMADTFPMKGYGHLVCHKNDIGSDNRIENLYKGDHSDNLYDAYRNGKVSAVKGKPAHNRGQGRQILITIKGEDKMFNSLGEAAIAIGYSTPTSLKQGIEANRGKAKLFNARYINEN